MAIRSKSNFLRKLIGISILTLMSHASLAESSISPPDALLALDPFDVYDRSAVTIARLDPSTLGTRIRSIPLEPHDTDLFRLPLIGDLSRIGFRTATADGGQFPRLNQYALFLDFKLPMTWSPWPDVTADPRLTFEVGRFEFGDEGRNFASLGPAVRFTNQRWRMPMFVDLGLSPTVIDGSRFGGRDLGTSLNFTSHIALGLQFGRQNAHTLSFRYQHISNGGINHTNPGTNMIGLDYVFWSVRR